jgi:hypothetical protein
MMPGTGSHQPGRCQDGTLETRYDTQLATAWDKWGENRMRGLCWRNMAFGAQLFMGTALLRPNMDSPEEHWVDCCSNTIIDTFASIGQDTNHTTPLAGSLDYSIFPSIKSLDGH